MRVRFITFSNNIDKPFYEEYVNVRDGEKPFDVAVNYFEEIQKGLGHKYKLAYNAYKAGRKDSVHVLYYEGEMLLHVKVYFEVPVCFETEKEYVHKDTTQLMTRMYAETIKKLKVSHRENVKEIRDRYIERIGVLNQRNKNLREQLKEAKRKK